LTAIDEVLALAELPDIMTAADQVDLRKLQLAAARERFAQHRQQIDILRRRAEDSGISEIKDESDLVPLLFPHSTYKSYPARWLTDGRWDRLTRWFGTVSATPMDGVAVDGITDIDDWLDRLAAAGHHVFSSSGTSGRSSFVDQNELDVNRVGRLLAKQFGWPEPVPITNEWAVFYLAPSRGPARITYGFQAQARWQARKGAAFALTDVPMRLGQLNRLTVLEASITAGTATPTDIADFNALRSRQPDMTDAFLRFGEKMVEFKESPIAFQGQWPQAYRLMTLLRKRGVPDGGWNPKSVIMIGGGTKGVPLPPDYREQLARFFGGARHYRCYGMSENSTHAPMCAAGRYHTPPWQIVYVLDETGEHVAPRDSGPVTGRGAVMDVAWDGHWGGLIGGDWVTVDYGRCACGRPGPGISDNVVRYADVIGGQDDKLSCAAAFDVYVRSALRTDTGPVDYDWEG
jgi:hypothetical protein